MNITLCKIIKTIDSFLFFGNLRKINRIKWAYKIYKLQKLYLLKMHAIFKYKNDICYTSKRLNNLGKLFDKYRSDKGYGTYKAQNSKDNEGQYYNDIYELLFFQHKQKTKLVLECGIGSKNPEIHSSMFWSRHSIQEEVYEHGVIIFHMRML